MPEPHLNVFNAIGKMLGNGQMSYLGPNRGIPRCRFTLIQARPHKLERSTRGFEPIIIPCEIYGRYAETFCALVGQDSWVIVEGRLRSYNMNGKYPQIRVVVRRWSVVEAVRPGRGFDRRTDSQEPSTVTGLPNDGEDDET